MYGLRDIPLWAGKRIRFAYLFNRYVFRSAMAMDRVISISQKARSQQVFETGQRNADAVEVKTLVILVCFQQFIAIFCGKKTQKIRRDRRWIKIQQPIN